jgi:L-2-hydroxyglutarate oxidase LhgO
LGRTHGTLKTSQGEMEAGYVINAAGLYADKIAKDFGFGENYEIIPFKGLYLYSDEPKGSVKTNIYPVPDLDYPFLGVHFTVTVDGKIKIGPTAIPAFWREHYRGLERFSLPEFLKISLTEARLFFTNTLNFRKLAFHELKKYDKSHLVSLASELLEGTLVRHYTSWGPSGIRAQLYDVKKKKLEMDFCFEGDNHSFHVLNAVSPAFTCALPFASFLVDEIQNKFGK